MKKRNLKEISQTDTFALTSIIDYWKDYEPSTVLLAYAELKRRNYSLDRGLIKRINEFCTKNNSADVETLLSAALKDIGYNSYDECYEKEIDAMKKAAAEQATKIEVGSVDIDHTEKKYPALRTISLGYRIFGWLIILATLIVALEYGQESGIFALFAIILGALIVLGVFAVAETIMVVIDIEHNTRTNTKK
jgi:hypothetical protein